MSPQNGLRNGRASEENILPVPAQKSFCNLPLTINELFKCIIRAPEDL